VSSLAGSELAAAGIVAEVVAPEKEGTANGKHKQAAGGKAQGPQGGGAALYAGSRE